MSDTKESSGSGVTSILGLAAVACVACCIGPSVAVLGATAALGVISTFFIGAAGLLIAVAAFVAVRQRRSAGSRAPRRRTTYLLSSAGAASEPAAPSRRGRAVRRRAGLFVVGVATESDTHSKATEAHEQAAEAHDEATEAHDEATEAAGHDEAAESTGDVAIEGPDEEGSVLGIDGESPAAAGAAVVASVALAVGLWLLKRRWLAVLAVAFGVVFAVFDIAEITHQIDESRAGLAVVVAVVAALHLAAAATAGLSTRSVPSS